MANTVNTVIKVNASQGISAFGNLKDSMRSATFQGTFLANTLSGALSAGIGLVTKGVGALAGAFNTAAETQQSMIGLADDFSKISGISFDESTRSIDAFTKRMAVSASTLPGATADYIGIGKAIQDNLVGSFIDAKGELDNVGYNEALDALSVSTGIRADAAGISASEAGKAVGKLLAGNKSLVELGNLDFFEQNTAVLNTLSKEVEKSGKDLEDFSQKELVELATTAIGVSDRMISESSKSVSGVLAGFQSSLFDPTTGLFGLTRELRDGGTLLSSISKLASTIFGSNGIIPTIGLILQDVGVSVDPMLQLSRGIESLNIWLQRFKNGTNGLSKLGELLEPEEFGQGLGVALGNLFNRLAGFVANMNFVDIGGAIGLVLAEIIDGIAGFIGTVDLAVVAEGALAIGGAAVVAIGVALASIDWAMLGWAFLKVIRVAIAALAVSMGAAIFGIGAPALLAITAAGVMIVGVFSSFANRWESIAAPVMNAISSFGSAIANLFRRMREAIANLSSIFQGSSGPVNSSTGRRTGNDPNRVPNAATGLNVGGLFGAIARERSAMPAGAQLVVANSSEAILNRAQQALLGSTGGGGLSVGSLTINAGGTNNPQQLAKQVMAELSKEWERYQASRMTSSYS